MRVLTVAGGYVRAGVSRVLSLIADGLVQTGHDVDSYFIKPVSSHPYHLSSRVVHTGPHYFSGCKLIHYSGLFWHLALHGNEYDKIIGFSEDANIPLAQIANHLGLSNRVVLSVHNPADKFSLKTKHRISQVYPKSHCVIGVSRGVCNDLIDIGVPERKVTFRPNPVNIAQVDELVAQSSELHLEENLFNFIAMGRLHSHKGFDLLINAYAMITKPSNHLTILGEGPDLPELQMQIDSLGLTDKITLAGSIRNPFPVLAQADCFVMSSRLEGWPMALMEAMAVGLPVVSFACPHGPDEIIEDGISGTLVNNGDINALAKAMEAIQVNPGLKSRLAEGAWWRVRDFDHVKVAQQWLEI